MRAVVRTVAAPLIILGAAAAVLAAPAAASAATLTITPNQPCFGTGERVNFIGTGFTPDGIVDFTRNGEPLAADPPLTALPDGTVNAGLTVFNESGVEQRSYVAIDRTNPANTASVPLTVSELDVDMRPRKGAPTKPRRIAAVGFTGGSRTLWAHIVFRGSVRNIRIGTLRGTCGTLRAKKRLFGRSAPNGRHLIHFDTSRMFRKRTAQRVSFSFRIFGEPSPPTDCQGYSPCLPPGPDVDCRGGSGDGPRYVDGPVYVRGDDPYGLDRDGNGVGCES
jgi:hypothetical protein